MYSLFKILLVHSHLKIQQRIAETAQNAFPKQKSIFKTLISEEKNLLTSLSCPFSTRSFDRPSD